jgi:hypothetical protein
MRLYLDDDTAEHRLVALLRKAGFDAAIPADFGMSGRRDPEHLLQAIRDGRAFLSKNYTDFMHLHALVVGAAGIHGGIILIRQDNDRKKDMTPKGIVAALARLDHAVPDLTNELVTLNDWR